MAQKRPTKTRTCPFCKETIKAGAVKCKHCGSVISDAAGGQPAPSAGKEVAVKRSVFRVLGFGILSPVIYPFYWFYVTRKSVSEELGTSEQDNPGLQTLGLVVPILNLFITYWLYRDIGKLREKVSLIGGFSAPIFVIILAASWLLSWAPVLGLLLFVASIIVYGFVVHALNEYWDKRTNGKAVNAPVTGGELAAVLSGIVAFVLLGMFAALILAALGGAQKGAGDARIKSDLNQYKTALASYQADHGKYPVQREPAPVTETNTPYSELAGEYLFDFLASPKTGSYYYYVSDGKNFGMCADLARGAGQRFEVGPVTSNVVFGTADECSLLD